MHLICRNLGAICGSTDEESDHSNYISAHEAAEHRKSWQLLDFYALKCRYLLDLRPSKTYTDLCITMYYKMKNIKIQVPHHKAVATIWLYAAKTLLIQEDIFFRRKV